MNAELLTFIEHSFVANFIKDKEITDISYNGKDLYYQHNRKGRLKSLEVQLNPLMANNFIRQIANMSDVQFSYSSPILDVSVSRYRINAVHSSITRVGDEKAISFSIRIGALESRVEGDKKFMPDDIEKVLLNAINSGKSIIIGGMTGSGKTELQKYLLAKLPKYSRIIVIDSIRELEFLRREEDLDITSWNVNPKIEDSSFESLIANALRSNPDWLIVSEARGKEMASVLNSVMTGHPIITTMHAKSIDAMPHRIVRMVQLGKTNESYEDISDDVFEHFDYFVYLKKDIDKDGNIVRRIDSIANASRANQLKIIYKYGTSTTKKVKEKSKQ